MNSRLSDRRLWLLTWAGFALVYAVTGHWWHGALSVDTEAADWASWRLAHTGSLDLADVANLPRNPFFVPVGNQIIPGRTMGVILLGVPLQVLLSPFALSPNTPGVLTAVICGAATMGNLMIVLRRLGGSLGRALAVTVVVGLGTATWTVASGQLWSHTSALLWASAVLLALTTDALWLAAIASIPLIWSRPHLAVVPAIIAVLLAREKRDLRALVPFVACGAVAFGALLVWNDWVFGHPSLGGDYYGQYVGERATSAGSAAANTWLQNVVGALVSPYRGLLLYSPIAILAAVGVVKGWRPSPAWARGAVLGGLAYQAIQFKLNDFTGGAAFFGNRLVLEMVLLCTPTAYVGYLLLAETRPRIVVLARILAALSIAQHATGAALAGAHANFWFPAHPWSTWLLWDDVRETGRVGLSTLSLSLVVCLTVALGAPSLKRTYSRHPVSPKE